MAEPRHRPDEVASRSFPTTFRGFDPAEVRRYLSSVAAALSAAAEREAGLREDLARARASLAKPEIDESVLMAALGEETTRVLVAARAAANDIRVSADENAAETLLRAHEEAESLRAAARADADELTRTAEGLLAVRTREADDATAQLMVAAGEEAERIRLAGLEEARALVAEARAVRERMLEDLRHRVRRAEASFSALQVGRDRILEALGGVRDALDEATDGLATAEARARAEAEPLAARAGEAAAAAVDEIAATLREPRLPELPVVAEEPLSAVEVRAPEEQEAEPEREPEPEPDEEVAAAASVEPVHTGEPSGPVAAVVPIGAVFQEHDEEELTPTHDAPASAPTTGEVPMIAATGTDTFSAERRSRRSRRALRLAGDPSVRAEEQRLASMRYLHRPRTGSEPDVHLPEDGMVVVEPPSADEAVRIVGREGPPPPRPQPPAPLGHGGPDEPAVTVLGPVATTPLPTRRPPGAGAPPPRPDADEADARGDDVAEARNEVALEVEVDVAEVVAEVVAEIAAEDEPQSVEQPEPEVEDEPEPVDRLEHATEVGPEIDVVEAAASSAPDVDDLFARLRASREQTSPEPAPALVEPAPEPAPAPVPADAVDDGDEVHLQARDAVTGPLEAQLAKMVKRLLQDHQSVVLEKLGAKRRPPSLELLGGIEDLVRPLAAATGPLLARAADAGVRTFTPAATDDAVPPVADLAGDVAANIVRDLRPRVEAALANEVETEAAEAVSIAFREWRGERVARLVGDALHAAYSRGCYVAAPKASRLRWIADDGEQACPDCDDNALAGGLRKGKEFPTGHRHPPAHTGCRCIVVRA